MLVKGLNINYHIFMWYEFITISFGYISKIDDAEKVLSIDDAEKIT